jgi:hypothetical protein
MTKEVVTLMRSSRSEDEWSQNAQRVKIALGAD